MKNVEKTLQFFFKNYIYQIFKIRYTNNVDTRKAFEYFFENARSERAIYNGYPEANWSSINKYLKNVTPQEVYEYCSIKFKNNLIKLARLEDAFNIGNVKLFDSIIDEFLE